MGASQNKLVIYKSKSGFTKRYAEWIAELLRCDIISYEERLSVSLSDYDMIIYGGGIYAGTINGISWLESMLPSFADKSVVVFATGATPQDSPAVEQMLKQNFSSSRWNGVQVFYLQSGISYEKMGFVNKIKMKIFQSIVKKNEGKNSETLKRIQRSFDLCKKTDVKPLVAFCQGDLSRSSLRRLES